MKTKFTYLLVGFMALLFTGLKAKAQEPEPGSDTTSVQMNLAEIGPLASSDPIYAVKTGNWNSDIWSRTPTDVTGTVNLRPATQGKADAVFINAGKTVTVDQITTYNGDLNVNGTLIVDFTLTIGKGSVINVNNGGSIIFSKPDAVIKDPGNGSGTTLTINSGASLTTANKDGFNSTTTKNSGITGSFQIEIGNTFPTYNAGANYTYNGTEAQNTGSGLPATLTGNLTISNPAGVTLTNANGITVNSPGILTVDGVLKTAASQTVSGTGTLTGSGTVHASRISATPDFLTQYTIFTKTLSNLTVDYNGAGNQTISTINYGHLTISSNGNRAVTLPSTGTIGISGNFNPTATTTTYTITGSTVNFNGSGAQTIPSFTFHNLSTATGGIKTAPSPLNIQGNLSIGNNTTFSAGAVLNLAGNFSNGGSFVHNNGSVNLNGSAQTVSGNNTSFYTLNLNGSGSKDFGALTITINKAFSADNGSSMAGSSTFIFTGNNGSITGPAAKDFFKLQINSGANIAADGGTLNISNSFTNNGTFTQAAGINTSFSNNQTLSGTGSTTFGGLTVLSASSLDAGTHNFTINGGILNALGNFNGGSATVNSDGNSSLGNGAGNLNFNHLTIASGTLSNSNNKSFNLSGNWTNNGTYTAGSETITLNGAAQTIGGSNSTTFNSLIAAGTADKTLSNSISVTTSLSLSDKKINTGNNVLTANNINRTTGYIVGNLRKSFSAQNTGRIFEIGTSLFAPATINFTNVNSPGFLTATTTGAVHSNIGSSNINPLQTVKRHWVITNDNALAFDNYAITLSYDESENEDTKHAPAYILGKFNPDTWEYPAVSPTPTANSLTATGLTSFSDFQVGRRKNSAPVLANIEPLYNVKEEDLLTFTASALDPDPLNKLIFSLEKDTTGKFPDGASIDSISGKFSWTPASGTVGTYSFFIKVTNNGVPPMSASQVVYITVTQKIIICNLVPPVISVSRNDKTFTGLDEKTITLGYGAQKLTLSASNGTASTDFSWSPVIPELKNPNSANPEFAPSKPGVYNFTVTIKDRESGCQASNSIAITVLDVICDDKNKKVSVSHKDGKINSVLCVSVNAVEAHLAHGDKLAGTGPLNAGSEKHTYYTPESQEVLKANLSILEHPSTQLKAYPNPFSKQSTVRFTVPNDEQKVTLEVYNLNGRKVSQLYEGKVAAHQPYSFQLDGSNLPSGVYLIRLTTSKSVETFRVILTE